MSSETRDIGDGLYTWQPATAAQTALKTLLAGLLDGSITDTVQLTIPGLVENAPTITDFGATAGQGKQQTLTVNRTQLPITITMSATLADTTSWSLMRVTGAGAFEAALSSSPATSMLYSEALTSTFHPPAAGWTYNLAASNSALANCGTRHATLRVRGVTAPTLTALTATAPASSQGPGTFIQCSTLTWTETPGDPAATWSFSQSGFHLATLPSARHATPAQSPQRVCTTQRPGQSTTLTLTGTNEAGTATRSVTVPWAGGQ